ncbi:MAG TPA: TRAP transporter substrate-binding protein DctP [Hyphomicrobiaceae bacterium]
MRGGYFCVLIGLLLLGPIDARAGQTKLRVTLQLPISNHLGTNLMQFKKEVERRSDGAITVEIYDNSRLFSDNEALGAVSSGAIEMATITYQQLTKNVPAIGIFEQPFLFNFEALVRAAADPSNEIRQLLDEAVLKATGTRVLWWQSYGSSVFFSKGQDARQPDGIRGRKVRVFGENMAHFTRYCGGIPFLISASKQHQAIKDGTVDMVMTGITGVDSRELWKVTDTITRTEHAALEFLVIINDRVWQSLDQRGKAVVSESSRMVEQDLRERMADIEAKAYAFAREKGMKIYEPSPDDVMEWRACSARLVEDYMKDAGQLAFRLMAAYGRLRTQPCCSTGPAGTFSLR